MRVPSLLFYVAFFSWCTCSFGKGVSQSSPDKCAVRVATFERDRTLTPLKIEPQAIVSDACASFGTIEHLNEVIKPSLQAVTKETDFFAYYRLNLFGTECPYWNDEHSLCGNIACAVTTLDDEKEIPDIWRSDELSKIEGPRAKHPGRKEQEERGTQKPLQGNLGDGVGETCVVEYDDECDEQHYCVPEDESAHSKGDYVSLLDNPEKFTGYAGQGAHMVWDAIYRENCFSRPWQPSSPTNPKPPQVFQAAKDLRHVLQAGTDPEEYMPDDTCLEKRVFHRVISGMHASISTHLCYDYLDQKTGLWSPNATCYQERLASHPDRVSNVYFNYALVLRAIGKLEPYLRGYTFCLGDLEQNKDTKRKVLELAHQAANTPRIFDESLMFQDAAGIELKEDFRNRFRNVSRLMDCVGCDKCRLWGKLQTAGYGTALKVLFELDTAENFYLKRTELVALVNTLGRISHSISALTYFRGPVGPATRPNSSNESPADPSPSTTTSGVEDEDFADWQKSDAKCENCHGPENVTASEVFFEEFDLVWRTFKFIMGEYIDIPWKLGRFARWEAENLWLKFVGLPVKDPVRYEMVRPPTYRNRDEL